MVTRARLGRLARSTRLIALLLVATIGFGGQEAHIRPSPMIRSAALAPTPADRVADGTPQPAPSAPLEADRDGIVAVTELAAEATASAMPSAAATPAPTAGGGAPVAVAPTPAAPMPVAPPPAAALPPPAPPAVAGACAVPMQAGAPAGWRRAVTSTFGEYTPIGAWPGPIASQAWRNRARGPDSSGRGTYDSSRTVSEANGNLDIWIHSEGETRYVAAPVSALGATVGARISICMRADVIPGYKLAFLLWPTEGAGNSQGEIDFPEGKLSGGGATARAFMHHAGRDSQDHYDSGVALQGWHTYTIEWDPTAPRPYVSFFVDGRLLGTSTEAIPTVPMLYVMQMETYMRSDPLPAPAAGHVQVDWVTIDLP